MDGNTAQDALVERGDNLVTILQCPTFEATQRATVFLGDDDIMGNIDKAARQVSGIGRLHGRIGQTLAGTVRRNEVFEHGHSLFEVGKDWVLDDLLTLGTGFLRLGHQSAHTRKLLDLVF